MTDKVRTAVSQIVDLFEQTAGTAIFISPDNLACSFSVSANNEFMRQPSVNGFELDLSNERVQLDFDAAEVVNVRSMQRFELLPLAQDHISSGAEIFGVMIEPYFHQLLQTRFVNMWTYHKSNLVVNSYALFEVPTIKTAVNILSVYEGGEL